MEEIYKIEIMKNKIDYVIMKYMFLYLLVFKIYIVSK